jgi:excisionase family DNA binding protein
MPMDDRPLRLPNLYREAEAAKALGTSVDTLRRERQRGNIAYTRIGGGIRYTETHLNDYIQNRTTQRCHASATSDPSRSATGGSAVAPTPQCGAELGSTPALDKHAAHLLAQATFKRPN